MVFIVSLILVILDYSPLITRLLLTGYDDPVCQDELMAQALFDGFVEMLIADEGADHIEDNVFAEGSHYI